MSLAITSDRVIKATQEWKQITRQGAGQTHFDRVFSVNDMKFNVKLKADDLRLVLIFGNFPSGSIFPRISIETESRELFVGYKILMEYSAGGKSGYLTCNPKVGSLSKFDSSLQFKDSATFKSIFLPDGQNTMFEINVTYKMTFEIELKKTEVPKKSKLLHKLYLEDELSDVKIHCDDKVFNCHKLILSGQSEVFKKMLSGNSHEATSGKIEITDASATTMQNLLFYIYHEDLQKDDAKDIVDLLIPAEKYAIADLVKICVKILKERLSEENVVDVMTAAFLTDQEDLFESAYEFIFKSRIGKQTVGVDAWKELEEKKPTLAFQMLKKAMFKL